MRFHYRPVYLCGEVEGDETTVEVPLVCKENWEEFMKTAPAVGFSVNVVVKRMMLYVSPLGMYNIIWSCH